MSQWEQHYYTWSTKSLSGNKVGLGIVAASDREERLMRVMEHQGAASGVCRDEENLTIERLSYSEELKTFLRSGATPCASGADKRNNKFVHIYSLLDTENRMPEEYLTPLPFEKEWDGTQKLSVFSSNGKKQETGRKGAVEILESFGLRERLPELFCRVYRCLLGGEKPVTFVDGKRAPEEFGTFSRQMMILVHSMLPDCLRKEADYVSYVKEDSQEAHFLFRTEGGAHAFDLGKRGASPVEYALLEQEFYEKLTAAFLSEKGDFEDWMKKLDAFLCGLSDKRNQLEKCIFAFMASEASRAKEKEAFFTGVERLMYWARKDESLIPALQEATKELNFHSMEEEELLLYTNLLLTGAGGSTKEMAFGELNRMLSYYRQTGDPRFDLILERICQKNHTVYVQILRENQEYADYVADAAYDLYRKTKTKEGRKKIAAYGKEANEKLFLKRKKADVKKVFDTAESFSEYLSLAQKIEEDELEEAIREMIFRGAVDWFEKTYPDSFLSGQEDGKALLRLGNRLSMEERISALYLNLLENQTEAFYRLDPSEWIRFVLKLTADLEKSQKSQAKKVIAKTRAAILQKEDLFFLAEINHVLKNHGASMIRCPKTIWEKKSVKDFGEIYKKIIELSLVKCEESPVYQAMDVLYHFVEGKCGEEEKRKIAAICRKKKSVGEDLLWAMAALWGKNTTPSLENFYPILEEKLGEETAAKAMDESTRENENAREQWEEFEKRRKKEIVREEKKKEKKNPIQNIVQDILSESIWGVLLGIYGYAFVHIRELFQKKAGLHSPMKVLLVSASEMEANLKSSVVFSIAVLIGLLLLYLLVTCLGRQKKKTPGSMFYVIGLGIFFANLALSFQSTMAVVIVFGVSGAVALALKLFSMMLERGK